MFTLMMLQWCATHVNDYPLWTDHPLNETYTDAYMCHLHELYNYCYPKYITNILNN